MQARDATARTRRDLWRRLRSVSEALLGAWANLQLPEPEELRELGRTLERVADDLERG